MTKKNWNKVMLATAVMTGLGTVSAVAAPEKVNYELPELVVTATRTENTVKSVPASTQVITSEELKRSGTVSVRNALSIFSNIFQKSITRGGGHDVIIRGMDTDKSLIMVNGRRVANEADASGLGNAMALDRINIDDVERIEIVRGPSSALYGSEAMGGVINIITKSSESPSAYAGLEQTSEDTSNWWRFDTGRVGRISATLDMRFNKMRRDMEEGAASSNDYGPTQTYNASLNYYFNDKNYINLYADYYSRHFQNDRGTPELKDFPVKMGNMTLNGQAKIDGGGTKDYKQQNYGISWNGENDKHQWQIQAYTSKFSWDSTTSQNVLEAIPGSDPMSQMAYVGFVKSKYGTYDFNHNTNHLWAVEGRDSIRLNDKNRLTFGAEYVSQTIDGTILGTNGDNVHDVIEKGTTKQRSEKDIDTYAAYIQNEMSYGKWFIVPALRYDHHEYYGEHTSPKLGVTYNASDHFRVKANYGDGFKAPNVSQLFYDLDMEMGRGNWVHLTGNQDLKPEESTSWDFGVEAEFGKGYGTLTYFDNDVDNLIESVRIGKDGNNHDLYQYRNVNTARIKGIENTLGYRFNDVLEFKVVSTWLDAKDTTEHQDLSKRAKLSQVYQLIYDDHKDKGWSAMLWNQFDYKYVTEGNGDGAPGKKKSYGLTNFILTRKVSPSTRIYGSVQNIFDKVDDECDLDGRFWSIGMEYKF